MKTCFSDVSLLNWQFGSDSKVCKIHFLKYLKFSLPLWPFLGGLGQGMILVLGIVFWAFFCLFSKRTVITARTSLSWLTFLTSELFGSVVQVIILDTASLVSLEFTKSVGSICLAKDSIYFKIATFTWEVKWDFVKLMSWQKWIYPVINK